MQLMKIQFSGVFNILQGNCHISHVWRGLSDKPFYVNDTLEVSKESVLAAFWPYIYFTSLLAKALMKKGFVFRKGWTFGTKLGSGTGDFSLELVTTKINFQAMHSRMNNAVQVKSNRFLYFEYFLVVLVVDLVIFFDMSKWNKFFRLVFLPRPQYRHPIQIRHFFGFRQWWSRSVEILGIFRQQCASRSRKLWSSKRCFQKGKWRKKLIRRR